MMPTAFTGLTAAALLGRHPEGIAADYGVEPDGEIGALVVAENHAVRDMLERRACFRLAPTPARDMAVQLMAGAALMCADVESTDEMVMVARDWIARMGDPWRHARAVAGRRRDGDEARDARLAIGMGGGLDVVLDVFDDRRIIATMRFRDWDGILLGVVGMDEEDDGEAAYAPEPELVA